MALVRLTVKSISGQKLTGTTQSIVFNAECIFDWETFGSDSRFRYILNPNDRRESALLVTVDDTIASKLAQANTAWGDVICKLPVVTAVGGTATDRYIPVRSIVWAEAYGSQSDYCLVKYCLGGSKVKEVIVPFSLNDLVYVGSTGTSSS